jgi:hypothetical protein
VGATVYEGLTGRAPDPKFAGRSFLNAVC